MAPLCLCSVDAEKQMQKELELEGLRVSVYVPEWEVAFWGKNILWFSLVSLISMSKTSRPLFNI